MGESSLRSLVDYTRNISEPKIHKKDTRNLHVVIPPWDQVVRYQRKKYGKKRLHTLLLSEMNSILLALEREACALHVIRTDAGVDTGPKFTQ